MHGTGLYVFLLGLDICRGAHWQTCKSHHQRTLCIQCCTPVACIKIICFSYGQIYYFFKKHDSYQYYNLCILTIYVFNNYILQLNIKDQGPTFKLTLLICSFVRPASCSASCNGSRHFCNSAPLMPSNRALKNKPYHTLIVIN